MAVDPLELGDEIAQVDAPPGRLDFEKFLGALDEAGGVGMRADPADPLAQVDVLDPGFFLGQLLHAAVIVAETEVGVLDDLAFDRQADGNRFLEGRVLGTDGDLEFHFSPPGMTSAGRSNFQSLRSGKFPAGQSSGMSIGRGSGRLSTAIPNMSCSSRS